MVVVAAIWEDGWNTPIKEFDLWYYPLQDFGVDEYVMTPVSGILTKKVKEFHTVEEILEKYKELPIILCDINGEQNLEEFKHPKDALYFFGRSSRSIVSSHGAGHQSLKIVTPNNKGTLWGHQAASIILYDRFLKSGNNI